MKSRNPLQFLCAKIVAASFVIALFLHSGQISGQIVETFTSSTTWLCPAGVTTITVECWGGGGTGGGNPDNKNGGGGGGGGGYSKSTTIAVIPGNNYTVTVGTGGTGTTGNGIAGLDSWFSSAGTIMARGGGGGIAGSGTAPGAGGAGAALGVGTTRYTGGNGGAGYANNAGVGGGGGSSAGTAANGVAGTAGGAGGPGVGGIAPAGGGNGGNGGDIGVNGFPGSVPGGAGGGSGDGNMVGGNGAGGKVVLTYTVPNCPVSTAVNPSATQTRCQGVAANLLTATVTLSGGSGTPTVLYQWYYNLTNSNTVAGATLISGATSSTYTPLTGAPELGTRYYFCVGYATNNGCGQTNATQSLASNTVQVTVNPPTPATPGVITGTTPQCANLTGQVYSIAAVPNATTYNWTVPTGWTITAGAGTTAITVTVGGTGQNGDITVTAQNSCGTSAARTLAVTVNPGIPATPGAITGAATHCAGLTGQVYSIAAVPNATTYNWTVPVGWTITGGAGTISITVTVGGAGQNGNITVTAQNSCGTSAASIKAVTVDPPTPATPGAITGTTPQCANLTGQVYSIAAVPNATTYNWTVPTGWTITAGAGTTAITVTVGGTGQNGNITVTAQNSCGTSAARTLAVTVNPGIPATPGIISGTTPQCANGTGKIYSIAAVPNATTYNWTVPVGWTITGGAGTISITVTVGGAGQNGNITVTAGNSCGTSAASVKAVTAVGIPVAGAISGPTPVASGTPGLIYSITPIPDATNYTWTVPGNPGQWTITAGQGTNSITVTSGTKSGDYITVYVTNACGNGPVSQLQVFIGVSPNCPVSTSVAPAAIQTRCQGVAANQLTATITTSGGGGTPTLLYQWYYNTINSNTVAGATLIAGATSQTYTPLTGAPEIGNRWYFCVGYATDNGCGQTNADQSRASNTVQVTVNPGTPAVPGVITGPADVGPGVTGIIYSIAAVPGATSYNWSVPAGWSITAGAGTTSITVTSGAIGQNGNISVTASNSCGTSAASILAVTVTGAATPTITLGANPSVCQGVTSANLTYTATTENPDQYSINYDATAEGQGFVDVTDAPLPASPIILVVPAGAAPGTYNANLTVKNSGTGLSSGNYAITVTVLPLPTITAHPSNSTVCTSVNANFSVTTSSPSPSYQWQASPNGVAWANTVNGGPAGVTYTNSTTATLTASGTSPVSLYYYRCVVTSGGCSKNSNSATLTINTVPSAAGSITGTANVCRPVTNVAYSTTAIPGATSYTWSYSGAGATFSSNPSPTPNITINFSAAATSGNLTVRGTNSCGNGTISSNYAIVVSTAAPVAPGAITGSATLCPGQSGIPYSVTPVAGATSYTWSYSGAGVTFSGNTASVTAYMSGAGTSGNITVRAVNACGTSASSPVKAISTASCSPHNVCDGCHVNHTFVQINNPVGNANLCMNCHTAGGAASGLPFTNAMKAVPGTSGNSHAWDRTAVNGTYETNLPANANMLDRVVSNQILCSTCHDQHSTVYFPFLRATNAGDAICKDCHSARNRGRWTDNPSQNKGTHPVGLTYNGGTGSLLASPTGSVILVSGKIECSSCHKVHYAATSDGYILRQTNNDVLCTSCHNYGQHNGMGCSKCHQTHNTNKANIYMIRNTVATPNSGNKAVVFTAESGAGSFADGASPYNGICEVCHTQPSSAYHSNSAPGTHNNGTNCISCHPHSSNFAPAACHSCHEGAPYPQEYPATGSHAVHAGEQYRIPCSTCHFNQGLGGSGEAVHPSGGAVEVVFNPNGLARRNGLDSNTPAFNTGTKVCTNIYCHSNGRSAYRGTNGSVTWSATTGPQAATYATTPSWATGSISACSACHPGTGNMTSPYTITSPGLADPQPPATGSHLRGAHTSNSQELSGNGWAAVNCFWCHNTNVGKSNSPINQGTYGTLLHVDGLTHFHPASFSAGGTMVGSNAVTGAGLFSYSLTGSAGHCGNGKQCW